MGLNRVYWDLRESPPFKNPPQYLRQGIFGFFGLPKGPFVLPGKYRVVLDCKGNKLEKEVVVKIDKKLVNTKSAQLENREMVHRLNDLMRKLYHVPPGVNMLNKQVQALDNNLKSMKKPPAVVVERLKSIREKIDELKKFFVVPGIEGYYRRPMKLALSGGPLPEQIYVLQLEISNYLGAPTVTQKQRIKEISAKVLSLLRQVGEIIDTDIPKLNRLLLEHKIEYIHVPEISQME